MLLAACLCRLFAQVFPGSSGPALKYSSHLEWLIGSNFAAHSTMSPNGLGRGRRFQQKALFKRCRYHAGLRRIAVPIYLLPKPCCQGGYRPPPASLTRLFLGYILPYVLECIHSEQKTCSNKRSDDDIFSVSSPKYLSLKSAFNRAASHACCAAPRRLRC